jgi:multiple sugar transport system substrate-binding protein
VRTAAYADYFTALQTQIAGGKAPDTFELNYENFYTYARNGALLALDDQAKADTTYNPGRVYPEALKGVPARREAVRGAVDVLDVVLFYNKKLFDAAGVAYPTNSVLGRRDPPRRRS